MDNENKDLFKIQGWYTILWFFPPLWIIRIVVGTRAGYIGDDGTLFMMVMFAGLLTLFSIILGITSMNIAKSLENKYENLVNSLPIKKFKTLAIIITLSPFISFFIQTILFKFFPQHPFSGL